MQLHRQLSGPATILAAAVLTCVGATSANTTGPNDTWLSGFGNWSDAMQWRSQTVPGIDGEPIVVVIRSPQTSFASEELPGASSFPMPMGAPSSYIVEVDGDVQLLGATLGRNDHLNMGAGRSMTFASDPVSRAGHDLHFELFGTFTIDGANGPADVIVAMDDRLIFNGGDSGRLVMTDPFDSRLLGSTGNESLVFERLTIEGAGRIGEGLAGVDNRSLIDANQPFGRMTIETSMLGLRNSGVIRARDFGRVVLRGGDVDNTGGLLEARSASTIDLDGVVLRGGSIETDVDAVVRSVIGDATLEDVHLLQGNVEVGQRTLSLAGTITNDGTIYILSGTTRGVDIPAESHLAISPMAGDVTLGGSGSVILDGGSIKTQDGAGIAVLINGPGHTISGGGMLGDDNLQVRNEGTIRADGDSPMVLNPRTGTSFENVGTIHVVRELYLTNGEYFNDGELIVEEGAEVILLPGATLTNTVAGGLIGGQWTVRGTDSSGDLILDNGVPLQFNSSEVTLDGPLSNFELFDTVNLNFGLLRLRNGRVFQSQGDFTNSGAIDVGAGCTMRTTGKLKLTSDSVVTVQIGNSPGASGRIDVGTRLTMAGALELTLAPGAQWSPGAALEIAQASSIVGAFSSITTPGRADLAIGNGAIIITPLPECPGELSGDDQINIDDLLILIDAWGLCPAGGACEADFGGDGLVDLHDLLLLLDAWGDCPTA